MHEPDDEKDLIEITHLSKGQRRVLGVLLEKAFTTPEYYPLTLKALITGANQKSNRSPVMNLSEDDATDVADELREMGLIAVVHTESGRSERYRHYMRRRKVLTEPQLAIMAELLLRGRQSIGDLRARASRMVKIETLPELREELQRLVDLGFVRSSAGLERRGVEIDHCWYGANEGNSMPAMPPASESVSTPQANPVPSSTPSATTQPVAPIAPTQGSTGLEHRIEKLEARCEKLASINQELEDQVEELTHEITRLDNAFEDLRRDLGS